MTKKKISKRFDDHCCWCEACSLFDFGYDSDPCAVGRDLWQQYYGDVYPGGPGWLGVRNPESL